MPMSPPPTSWDGGEASRMALWRGTRWKTSLPKSGKRCPTTGSSLATIDAALRLILCLQQVRGRALQMEWTPQSRESVKNRTSKLARATDAHRPRTCYFPPHPTWISTRLHPLHCFRHYRRLPRYQSRVLNRLSPASFICNSKNMTPPRYT